MADLLFEIGTEEIPARFMPKALADLAQYAAEELDGAHVAHGEIKSECTPLRYAEHKAFWKALIEAERKIYDAEPLALVLPAVSRRIHRHAWGKKKTT